MRARAKEKQKQVVCWHRANMNFHTDEIWGRGINERAKRRNKTYPELVIN